MNSKFISWKDISLTGGFWQAWQNTVAVSTSNAIYDRFYETGRFEAMKLEWKEGEPNRPHVFWDSDIAKWMEGTAYVLFNHKDEELSKKLENVIDMIEKGQDENGYFNSAFLTLHPEDKFTDRTDHELYTAGHFIEAAIAHHEATGDKRFLNMMCRFADYIEKVFVIDKSSPYYTPGHQEVELALYRLYLATGEKRYLKTCEYFVNTRGKYESERIFSVLNGTAPAFPRVHNQIWYNDTYAQDEAPAKDLQKAGGHAVRAMYFYTAMADLARENGDEELFNACRRLWDDEVFKKMYITGGVSADKHGEAIGTDYVLPNDYSYAETCASVAMANFSERMFTIEPNSRYSDMIERQMYNGALAGLSIDGETFFYDNALLSRPEVNEFFEGIHATFTLPANQRLRVFDCSCCPPNVYRFIAALGKYFYSSSNEILYIHHYGESCSNVAHADNNFEITQKTNYPWDGAINISVKTRTAVHTKLAVRIPAWCKEFTLLKNGEAVQYTLINGYAVIDSEWQNDTIDLVLKMDIVQMEANPKIIEDAGKIALMRGPIVYCLESKDQDFNIFDLTIGKDTNTFTTSQMEIDGLSVVAIEGEGFIHAKKDWDGVIYQEYKPSYENVKFKAIPYFSWSNRGAYSMTVWIKKQN